MNYFLAVNDRQLGTCLRMLFAEKLQPAVQTVLNEKGKIEFHICGKILRGGDVNESQIQNVLSGSKKRRHMDNCYQRI